MAKKNHKENIQAFINANQDEEYEAEVKRLLKYVTISPDEIDQVKNEWTKVWNANRAYSDHYKLNPSGLETAHARIRMVNFTNEMWNTVNTLAFSKDDADALFDSATTRAQAAALYNYSGLARNIVDIPISDALQGFKIECPELNDEQITDLKNSIDSFSLFDHIVSAVTYADLWGGGALIPQIEGRKIRPNMPMSLALKRVKPGFLKRFTVIDHWRLVPIKYKGLPSIWEPNTIVTQYYTGSSFEDGFNIHQSRMSKVYRPFASTLGVTSSTYTGFGISVYNLMKRQILNYERAINLIYQMFLISSRTYLEPNENFFNQAGGTAGTSLGGTGNAAMGQTDPKAMLAQINQGLNTVNDTNSLDARWLGAFKLTTHDKKFNGVDDAIDALKASLSANSGIDQERLFGEAHTGFNTGESGREIYNSKKQQIWKFARSPFLDNIRLIMLSTLTGTLDAETLKKAMLRLVITFDGEEKTMRTIIEEAGIIDIYEGADRGIIPKSSASTYVMDKIKGMDYSSPQFEETFKSNLEKIDLLDQATEEDINDLTAESVDAAFSGDDEGAEKLAGAAKDIDNRDMNNAITLRNGKDFVIEDVYFFQGLPIKIENKKGSTRSGTGKDGEMWENRMDYDYGFISGTKGVDGDGVDVYVGENPDSKRVFVVKQKKIDVVSSWEDGKCPDCEKMHDGCHCPESFDEDKVMLGFSTLEDAEVAYLSQYNDDRFLGPVLELSIDEFKEILANKDGKVVDLGE